MDELSDVAVVEALRRQLTIAATKQAVAASNLANAETPGYKTKEVRFDELLEQGLGAASQPASRDPGAYMPCIGSQPSSTANAIWSRPATQNTGIE